MRLLTITVLVLTVACGATNQKFARSSPTTIGSASASAPASPTTPATSIASPSRIAYVSPNPAGSALFAAIGSVGVLIAGTDGVVRASTAVTPILHPPIGCLGTGLPTDSYVVGGKVFFADGRGVIRSLSPNGQVQTVATFPTSSQQMLSFAVSPDASRLLATVLTVPALTPNGTACRGAKPYYASNFGLDFYSAQARGAARFLYHESVPEASYAACITELAGWDAIGPYAISPACLGPGGGPAPRYLNVLRLDPVTGQVLKPVADPTSCRVEDIASNGDYVCNPVTPSTACCGTGGVSVRRSDGTEIWSFTAPPNDAYDFDILSPDERHVLAKGFQAEVLVRDGTDLMLPESLFFDGWLGSSAVVADLANGDLAYATLDSPSTLVDLGFAGTFIGTVQV